MVIKENNFWKQTLKNIRFIPRLDIKNNFLIKGINLEGLRKIGNPNEFAKKYYKNGADEILFIDCVASLYGRNSLNEIIRKSVEDIYVPITVGGGIRSIEDIEKLLNCGADKVAINTAAVNNPDLINSAVNKYGSSTIVISIEAKKKAENIWEVYVNNGRDKTGKNLLDWVIEIQNRGAGEILLTSVDNEGTRNGFDIEMYAQLNDICNIPIIASGGMGTSKDIVDLVYHADIQAVAFADIIHYNRASILEIKNFYNEN